MKIKDICTSITDGSHNPPAGVEDSNNLMLSSKNIFDGRITFDDPRYLSDEDFEKENKRTQIKPGDVLLTIVGTVGRTAVVPLDIPKITLQRSVAVLHPDEDICAGKFLMYALQGKRSYIESRAKGVAQKGIYLGEVSDIDLYIPEHDRQAEIIDNLDKVNNLLQLKEQEIERFDSLIKARFVEMFGACNMYKEIGNCGLFISDGNYSSKYPRSEEFVEYGVPFIRANNLKDGTVIDDDLYHITEEKHEELQKGHVKENDVLITTRGNLGQTAVVPQRHEDSNINAQIVLLRVVDDSLEPIYLRNALNTIEVKKQISSLETGTALKQLPVNRLQKIRIPIPEMAKQKQFAAFVAQVDKSKVICA